MRTIDFKLFTLIALTLTLSSCLPSKPLATSGTDGTNASDEYIYISTGATYAGNGVTMSTPSRLITKFETDGTFVCIVADFVAEGNGDSPVQIADYNSNSLLVLLENAGGRRIALVSKDCQKSTSNFIVNATAMAAAVRSMITTPDGGLLVSKAAAIEKFNSSKQRLLSGANPYVSAPAGVCATSNTAVTKMALGPSNNIFMLHSAASPNNQINIISSAGYNVAGDCLGGIDAPSATHYPTSILYHSSGKMFVSYANTAGPIHQIYQYDVTGTTITNPILSYNDLSIVQGPVDMKELSDKSIIIASGVTTLNTVEKFTLNSATGILTRASTIPLIPASIYTQGISSLLVAK